MAEKKVILVIEDERSISNFICRALTSSDYRTVAAFSGKEALTLFFSHRPDLILLDLGLPDTDGFQVLEELGSLSKGTPLIIISARDRESEKVRGLDQGADDYIVKPFGVPELLARIRSALRRSDRLTLSHGTQRERYEIKDLVVDIARHQVLVGEEVVHFTQNEFKILELLCLHAGKVLTYDFIMQHVWGPYGGGEQPDPSGEYGQYPPQAPGKPLRAPLHPHRAGHWIPDVGGFYSPLSPPFHRSFPFKRAPRDGVRASCFHAFRRAPAARPRSKRYPVIRGEK